MTTTVKLKISKKSCQEESWKHWLRQETEVISQDLDLVSAIRSKEVLKFQIKLENASTNPTGDHSIRNPFEPNGEKNILGQGWTIERRRNVH